ncbi:hypothetical protein QOT17_009120 [Balamuthia mandrillaris]
MHKPVHLASASSTQTHSSNIKAQHDYSKPLHEFTAGSCYTSLPGLPSRLLEYSGPFTVIHHNHGGVYLQDSTGVTLSDKFSPNQLKLIAPPEDSTNELLPASSVLVDGWLVPEEGKAGERNGDEGGNDAEASC